MSRFDSVLLGDNPFFGVDHLSYERARQRMSSSKDFASAVNVIKHAYEMGINEMMVTTRPRLDELFSSIENNTDLLDKISFYPLLPYAQGYVLKLSQLGPIGTLKDIFSNTGIKNELKLMTKGGIGFLQKDLLKLFQIFLDIEILKLQRVNVKTIFLHPAVTDLALSMNLKTIFQTFVEYVHDNYEFDVGLCTKNFPRLVDSLQSWDIKISNIMTSFNNSGFLMNPSKPECEKYLEIFDGKVIGMNIFAGGFSNLNETFDYVQSLPKLRSVVIGISSESHAKETFSKFNTYD